MHIPPVSGPHGFAPILHQGNERNPTKALILVHGRGANAGDILGLTNQLSISSRFLVLAPHASSNTWYPERFIVSKDKNQPFLDSAIDKIHGIIGFLETEFALLPEHIIFAGFSQGACLVAEYLQQYPRKYQGAAIFSGALIGSDSDVNQMLSGDLQNTPIYMGCDELDAHIPLDRFKVSANILGSLQGNMTIRIYQHLGHAIHPEGILTLQSYLDL